MNVGTAEETYVDPSALVQLFLHQQNSREMAAWRARNNGPLHVTHHGRTELVNAICRAAFLQHFDAERMHRALTRLEGEFTEGRFQQADILWRAALHRATGLSRTHTPTLGTRSADVLHVACALELKLPRFLSFDHGQQKLAAAEGLKLVQV